MWSRKKSCIPTRVACSGTFGLGAPLDFTTKMSTHLNADYLSGQLAGFSDQEMVHMITVTGIDFKISQKAGQTVIFPHLESLGSVFLCVEKELLRLNELTFNDSSASSLFFHGALSRMGRSVARRRTESAVPRRPAHLKTNFSARFSTKFSSGGQNMILYRSFRLHHIL